MEMLRKIKHDHNFILLACLSCIGLVSSSYSLKANAPKIINLNANQKTSLKLQDFQNDTTYIICQAHSQNSQLTLSTSAGFYPNSSATGHDVGVVSIIKNQSSVNWFLRLDSNADAKVLVHATVLKDNDPLPGGCNEEFNTENDPNIHLDQASTSATVKFQWSNTGYDPRVRTPYSCERGTSTTLQYQGYARYMESADFSEDTYFKTLEKMLLAEDVIKHGTWVEDLQSNKDKKSMFTISSYSSQGVIYTVVVKETNSTTGEITQAAYIPVVSYDCNIDKDCKSKNITAIIFSTLALIVGAFLCFFGHRFFKTENFIFGFLIFATIFYQVLALKTGISLVGILVLTGVLGCVGGVLLLGVWWRLGVPVLNVLLISLVFGYLFSSVLFYTPFANITWWDSLLNYGMAFTCGVLVLPVFMLCFTRFLNIVSCAVVGSYGVILAIDVYLGSGMKHILMNSLRHGTDVNYVKVHIMGPFTTKEIILTVVWIFLAVSGTIFQLVRERKKAPFPPCPHRQSDGYEHLRSLLHRQVEQASSDTEPILRGVNSSQTRGNNPRQPQRNSQATSRGHGPSQNRGDNPRQPLLPDSGRKGYGSTNAAVTVDENADENRPGLV